MQGLMEEEECLQRNNLEDTLRIQNVGEKTWWEGDKVKKKKKERDAEREDKEKEQMGCADQKGVEMCVWGWECMEKNKENKKKERKEKERDTKGNSSPKVFFDTASSLSFAAE